MLSGSTKIQTRKHQKIYKYGTSSAKSYLALFDINYSKLFCSLINIGLSNDPAVLVRLS